MCDQKRLEINSSWNDPAGRRPGGERVRNAALEDMMIIPQSQKHGTVNVLYKEEIDE